MTLATTAEAWAALRAKIVADFDTIPLRFQNETLAPVDDQQPFAMVTFQTYDQRIASFGGGRGDTRWRNFGALAVYVVMPKGRGLAEGLSYAEEIAAVFRAQTFSGITCLAAAVDPAPLTSEGALALDGNYDICAAIVELRFDQVG